MKKVAFAFLIILIAITAVACGTSDNGNNGGDNKDWNVVKEATCTEKGLKRLGEGESAQEETIPALGHNFDDYETSIEPLCTEVGYMERTCNRCGHTETEPIEAKGHNISDNFFVDKAQHWHECTDCERKFDSEEHSLGDYTVENFSIHTIPEDFSTDNNSMYILDYKFVYSYRCDDCDAIIQEISVADFAIQWYTPYHLYYDDDYNLIKVIKNKDKDLEIVYDITYRPDGQIWYIRTDENSLFLRIYDDNGQLKEIRDLYAGNIRTDEEVIESNVIWRAYYYDFDSNGKLIYWEEDYRSFNPDSYVTIKEWTYHDNGNKASYKQENPPNKDYTGSRVFERYDEYGKLIYAESGDWYGDYFSFYEWRSDYYPNGTLRSYEQIAGTSFTDIVKIYYYTYDYDSRGNIIKEYEEYYSQNQVGYIRNYIRVYEYEYEYDDSDNLIKIVKKFDSKSDVVTNYAYNKYNTLIPTDREYRWIESLISPNN